MYYDLLSAVDRQVAISGTAVYQIEELNVPDSIVVADMKFAVVKVSENAFRYNRNISKVHLPDAINEIGNEAFKECYNLREINLPDAITKIGQEAFSECRLLKSVHFPESLLEIGSKAFYYCTGLENIILNSKVTTIWGAAFLGFGSAKSIWIPKTVEVGGYAF